MKNPVKLILFAFFILSPCIIAKSYSIDQIDIIAEVLENGSLQITESRTYTFRGSYKWADYQLPLDRLGDVELFSLKEGSQNYYQSNDELPGSYFIETKNNTFLKLQTTIYFRYNIQK